MVPNFVASYRLNRWKPVGQEGSLGGGACPPTACTACPVSRHLNPRLVSTTGGLCWPQKDCRL